jgi:hypothetical protein
MPLPECQVKIAVADESLPEAGQAAISVVLILGLFLVGILALAVDFTNIWFHRQAAGAAADAACQAGAMDLLVKASGVTLSSAGFTAGTPGDCVSNSSATMCAYAAFNGYSGTGLVSGAASNSVSWTFPSSVTGVTTPPAVQTAYPFLKVSIVENVGTYFLSILNGAKYQELNVACTCGIVQSKVAAPMVVLNPTIAGSFSTSGGGVLKIVGGPQRSVQVNSTSSTAVQLSSSGLLDLSTGGPNQTGGNIGIFGGPSTAPTSGYTGGSTGLWKPGSTPIPDPFGGVPPPASIASIAPSTGTKGKSVPYLTDGCPDHSGNGCVEYGPGYYPSGLNVAGGSTTAIFLPGIYYLNGDLAANAGNTLRNAKPAGSQRTDGVMFYFLTGSFKFAGGTGTPNPSVIDNVSSSDLTCDGNPPPSALNIGTSLPGNVLIAQCTQNGTYWDSGSDTTDSRGTPGSRGILAFQDHANTNQPTFGGGGALAFSGAMYFHSTGFLDVLSLQGGAGTGTLILGLIIADQVSIGGGGTISLALTPLPSTDLLKVAVLQ